LETLPTFRPPGARAATGDALFRRWLIVAPAFHDWDLGSYVRQILESKRATCHTFAYVPWASRQEANSELLRAIERCRPEVVLGLKLDRIEPGTIQWIRSRGIFCFLWYVDCFDTVPPRWLRPLLAAADAVAITAKGLIAEFERYTSRPVDWVYEGAHLPSFPVHPRPFPAAAYRADVAFVGNIYHPAKDPDIARERQYLLKSIQARYDLKVWGAQGDPRARHKWGSRYPVIAWPAHHEELVRICRSSGVMLGINLLNNVELYFSNRTFLTLACGGFHLTHYVPGLETMFANEKHLVWYRSQDECLELIEFYLSRPRARRRIAAAGRDWVRRRYSMTRQVNRIVELVARYAR
jgi:hypothetical protein